MRNRVFFPQPTLDDWVAADRADFASDELTFRPDGRRYRMVEAVRVLREVTGSPDPHEIVGRVKSRAFFAELGAEVFESSMIIGDNAYDVVQGFVGPPIGTLAEHNASAETPVSFATEDERLAAFMTAT